MNSQMLGLFLVVTLCLIVLVTVFISVGNAKAETIKQRLRVIINAEDIYVSPWDSSFIGLSFEQSKIAIGRNESLQESHFSEIIQVDLVRNDDVATSTDKGSLASRALVGGVLLGGVGAVIGAVTARTHSSQKLGKLALRIITESGTSSVTFLDIANLQREGLDALRNSASSEADRFYGLVLRAMRQADGARQAIEATVATRTVREQPNVSTEIEKLWQLKERGIISADEFALAKARVLPPT